MGYFKIFCVFSALLWAKLIFPIPPKNAVYHASKAAKTLSDEKMERWSTDLKEGKLQNVKSVISYLCVHAYMHLYV